MKKKFLFIPLSLLFCSCIFEDFGSDSNIIFKTYWSDDVTNYSIRNSNTIILDSDTLNLSELSYVITDLKLVNDKNTIEIADAKIMSSYENISFDDSFGGVYDITFNFGIEYIEKEYNQLNAQNFDVGDGYYFLKMKFKDTAKDSLYSYNIAKKSINSKIESFKVTIKGFDLNGGFFVEEAIIGLNLKNLLTKPNLINIDSLTSNSLNNEELQLKMIKNAKNVFFLEGFAYD